VLTVTETSTPAAKPENVGRGTLFALASILLAILAFIIVGWAGIGLYGVVLAGLGLPFITAALYRFGSGGQLTRAGWVPFIVISAIAVVVGVVTGVIATVARQFGGGGQMWSALWLNLKNFDPARGGQGFFAVLGIALGVVGIILALRQKTPAQQIAQTTAQWTPPAAPAADATTPPAPPAAPPAAPSPGVVLNGEPVDPDKKK
jgi:hypothetical protein